MALGSVATIAVLAAALIEVPKFRNARAVQNDARTDASATTNPQQTPAADPVPAAATVDSPPASATPPAAEANTPSPTPARVARTDTQPPAAKSSNVAVSPQKPPAQVAVQQTPPVQTVQQPVVQQPIVQQPEPVVQPAPPTSPPVPVGGSQRARANAAEIRDLQQLYDLLAVRAGTAKSGLASLKQQMARQGLGLRGDIVAAEGRMDLQMRRAEDAIRNGDADEARNSLQLAERAVETIEKFLGR